MKRTSKYLIILLTMFIICSFFMGCKPKGDPNEVISSYYDNIKSEKFDDAYEVLASINQSQWAKEDYEEIEKYQMEFNPMKDYSLDKIAQYNEKDIDGVNFKNVVEYNVTEKIHNNYSDKDIDNEYTRYVVDDGGEWKVYKSEMDDPQQKLSEAIFWVALLYEDGKGGKDQDLNKAATLLNDSVTKESVYEGAYYEFGVVLCKLQRFDESISNINSYLECIDDDKSKSNAFNVLGLDYEGKEEYSKAKDYFNEAIQLDDNNQYAKTNLQQLEQLLKLGIS
ncbi:MULTISPECIES: tetratricopeptide repeat protein [unclassified Clostridium]|uniref:tetratricopeptide repeat protein n=1 Tax=unclassified Clostridium TaxID=2614128 RepID=UPI0005FAD20E|nr:MULTISPECIES: tetratricopeptide repeat protein [unclassified Clostridium]MDU1232645.1 tetratricopeptide repeat protein [Clostridium sp.]MDU3091771.1 tetratricopeptide repeat protein [Clostridium sp.]